MRFFVFLIVFLLSFTACAEDALMDLLGLLQPVNSLVSRFEQTTFDKNNKELQLQSGHLAVKKSGEFFWKVSVPFEQEIISDGKSVYVYDPDLEQVTIKKLDNASRMIPLLLFSGDSREILKHYRVENLPSPEKQRRIFSLKPLQADNLFNELLIEFVASNPRQLEIRDGLGQDTRVVLGDVELNKVVPAEYFHFVAAPGIDVIDER